MFERLTYLLPEKMPIESGDHTNANHSRWVSLETFCAFVNDLD